MKKVLSIIFSLLLIFNLVGCSSGEKEKSKAKSSNGKEIITVGATPVPHKEILEQIKPLLEEKGYELKIVEFTDYVTPNTALQEGDLDANFFQHLPYLKTSCEEKKLDLDYTVKIHIEPMGLYSNKIANLSDLPVGATIAIPNDPSNGARALRVLENAGLIKVNDGELISKLDITENPKEIKIQELDAPQLPRVLEDVDAAVINTNYAIEANLNPSKDALAIESKDSPYANILAVRKDDKDKTSIKVLSEVLTSEKIKNFILEKYDGNIVPTF